MSLFHMDSSGHSILEYHETDSNNAPKFVSADLKLNDCIEIETISLVAARGPNPISIYCLKVVYHDYLLAENCLHVVYT